ncbi:MAG: histidine kinase [Lachnospiraceae bacterium]|jgi:two-component system sensor histidine kinase YesM|nr:histidine kinase [Lachnospiraceae bacterium]
MHSIFSDFRISLRRWFLLYGTVCAAILVLLSAFTAVFASSVIQKEAYDSAVSGLDFYRQQLETEMHNVELYLAGFNYNSTLLVNLNKADPESSEWFSAEYYLQEEFTSTASTHTYDNYFFFYPEQNFLITNRSFTASGKIQKTLSERIRQDIQNKQTEKKWTLITIDDQPYLLFYREQNNGYVGSCLDLNAVKKTFTSRRSTTDYDFSTSDGTLICSNPPVAVIPDFGKNSSNPYNLAKIGNELYLVIAFPIANSPVSLLSIAPDRSITSSGTIFRTNATVILALCLLLFIAFSLLSRNMISAPVSQILNVMKNIKAGRTAERVQIRKGCSEFVEIGRSFNETMDEIDHLKIAVYEEKLDKKQTQIEYLKLQVTPHFLVNCLNSIHQLVELGKNDLCLQMTEDLTKVLRYLLSCGRTVSLETELQQASNYVDLSQIRYPDGVSLKTDVAPALLNARIIPYLILGFVENTVKYEVGVGSGTVITVHAELTDSGFLRLVQCDTGAGYSEDALNWLNKLQDLAFVTSSSHIGIENICRRAKLVFGDQCHFEFRNDPVTGGAVKTVEIPYAEWEPGTEPAKK